jgi:PAS domain S-box-containing protein
MRDEDKTKEQLIQELADMRQRIGKLEKSAIDITEYKRVEEELRLHSEIIANMVEGVILTRISDGTIVYTNPKFEEMFGYSHEELVGKNISVVNAPTEKSSEEIAKGIQRSLRKTGVWSGEVYNIKKDGTPFWCYANVSTFEHLKYGKVWVAVHTDITERKQAEEALQKTEEQIRRHSEELEEQLKERTARIKVLERQRMEQEKLSATGRITAHIAHEINNPLAGIKNSFLLIKDAIPENHQYYQYVGMIEREINRIAYIVRRMYDLYRQDPKVLKEFCVDETIYDVVAMLKHSSQAREVNIDIEIPEPSIVVVMQEGYLTQVLFNIIQNAIEASPQGGVVKIILTVDEEILSITVSDQGSGIPEELHSMIFEPFFTTKNGSTMHGLGLGLSASKSMVEVMGGTIDFESQKDYGTVFRITLPLAKAR